MKGPTGSVLGAHIQWVGTLGRCVALMDRMTWSRHVSHTGGTVWTLSRCSRPPPPTGHRAPVPSHRCLHHEAIWTYFMTSIIGNESYPGETLDYIPEVQPPQVVDKTCRAGLRKSARPLQRSPLGRHRCNCRLGGWMKPGSRLLGAPPFEGRQGRNTRRARSILWGQKARKSF